MNVGDVVTCREPQTTDEQHESFIVVELRGPRVLVALIDNFMTIRPTFSYAAADLKGANQCEC